MCSLEQNHTNAHDQNEKLSKKLETDINEATEGNRIYSHYRMAKTHCHINRYIAILICKCAIFCDSTSRQITQDFRETYKTENLFILTFIMIRQTLRQKNACCTKYVDGRATKNFSRTVRQLLHQYHKILALCNIKRELPSSFPLNIARSQYFVLLPC